MNIQRDTIGSEVSTSASNRRLIPAYFGVFTSRCHPRKPHFLYLVYRIHRHRLFAKSSDAGNSRHQPPFAASSLMLKSGQRRIKHSSCHRPRREVPWCCTVCANIWMYVLANGFHHAQHHNLDSSHPKRPTPNFRYQKSLPRWILQTRTRTSRLNLLMQTTCTHLALAIPHRPPDLRHSLPGRHNLTLQHHLGPLRNRSKITHGKKPRHPKIVPESWLSNREEGGKC